MSLLHLPSSHHLPMQRATVSLGREDMPWAFTVWCSYVGCRWHVPALDVEDAVTVLERHLTQAHAAQEH